MRLYAAALEKRHSFCEKFADDKSRWRITAKSKWLQMMTVVVMMTMTTTLITLKTADGWRPRRMRAGSTQRRRWSSVVGPGWAAWRHSDETGAGEGEQVRAAAAAAGDDDDVT